MIKKLPIAILTLFVSVSLLSGCGIKPKDVDPPEGAEESTFPQTYPDLSTDPQPGLDQKDTLKNK